MAAIIKQIVGKIRKINFIYIININEETEKELTSEGRRIHSPNMVLTSDLEASTQ